MNGFERVSKGGSPEDRGRDQPWGPWVSRCGRWLRGAQDSGRCGCGGTQERLRTSAALQLGDLQGLQHPRGGFSGLERFPELGVLHPDREIVFRGRCRASWPRSPQGRWSFPLEGLPRWAPINAKQGCCEAPQDFQKGARAPGGLRRTVIFQARLVRPAPGLFNERRGDCKQLPAHEHWGGCEQLPAQCALGRL